MLSKKSLSYAQVFVDGDIVPESKKHLVARNIKAILEIELGPDAAAGGRAMNPKRIQLRRTKGWRKPSNTIVVSRPSKWGNPFTTRDLAVQPGYETPNEIVVAEFERWLKGESPYDEMQPERRQWILDNLPDLRGKNLACWCKESDACHADVLLRLANEPQPEAA